MSKELVDAIQKLLDLTQKVRNKETMRAWIRADALLRQYLEETKDA